ncbi:9386_t:CDS:2, partial [Entrophospora sp. SA101]
ILVEDLILDVKELDKYLWLGGLFGPFQTENYNYERNQDINTLITLQIYTSSHDFDITSL